MCGIVGFTSSLLGRETILQNMVKTIAHRGPDDVGFFHCDALSLGFCRLSIQDRLPRANQPMQTQDGRYTLVFNGEIYNFHALRADLESKSYRFFTDSDTEVLLYGYAHYGAAILEKLRGMFAFAIYDRNTQSLFCARDPFGIKPFYYTITPERALVFASEAKALFAHPWVEKRLDERALRAYLGFQYTPTSLSFFKDVCKLPPGHFLRWQNDHVSIVPYDLPQFCPDKEAKEAPWQERLHDALCDSVALHRLSDVSVGAFLSGGVDSSYLCALLRPQHTFSVGFSVEERFDEIPLAKSFAQTLGITHHHRYLEAEECMNAILPMQYYFDEPHANPSAIPLWFLAKEARKHVTVVLSGEGADELFGGYDTYLDAPFLRRYRHLPPTLRKVIAQTASTLPYFRGQGLLCQGDPRLYRRYIGQACIFTPKESYRLLRSEFADLPTHFDLTVPALLRLGQSDELTKKQQLDLAFWLPCDILQKADKMSMATSLELRVPYLDRAVFAVASRLPPDLRVKDGVSKVLLRNSAAAVLPKEIAFRQKKGFPVPIRHWFRLRPYYLRLGDAFSSYDAAHFFSTSHLLRLLREHYEGSANHARKLYCVYAFLCWYRNYFSSEGSL